MRFRPTTADYLRAADALLASCDQARWSVAELQALEALRVAATRARRRRPGLRTSRLSVALVSAAEHALLTISPKGDRAGAIRACLDGLQALVRQLEGGASPDSRPRVLPMGGGSKGSRKLGR